MGIKDQFQDKANELKEQAQKAMGAAPDEASDRGQQAKPEDDVVDAEIVDDEKPGDAKGGAA
ncbi:hypothetical protein [Streptomyces chattanoogensis]|uniref:Uncharacterized protein n=1 Tax=Streptomyces chattanoogensis TaxID=66876 RepID=A0A0N0GVD9_9ACTN|nr:hypothetical protein [Streptomyces chattanoogensis]KPC59122.1 hypothetical protein ADL29_36270 [Streptomyces chattanoogensis]